MILSIPCVLVALLSLYGARGFRFSGKVSGKSRYGGRLTRAFHGPSKGMMKDMLVANDGCSRQSRLFMSTPGGGGDPQNPMVSAFYGSCESDITSPTNFTLVYRG